jgi:hypothetical protein
MGCGCRGKSGNRGVSSGGDLTKFAFLTPRQLKLRDAQLAAKKAEEEAKKEAD